LFKSITSSSSVFFSVFVLYSLCSLIKIAPPQKQVAEFSIHKEDFPALPGYKGFILSLF
jgi:hypothetical protein